MTLLTDPRLATVVLTSGGMWTHEVRADPGTAWPAGTAHAVFYDTAGGIIADLAGTVADAAISFSVAPAETDVIPAGAGFDLFLVPTVGDGPYKIRYGRVIRKEVTFPDAPGSVSTFDVLRYRDTFQRTALGSRWINVDGRTSIHTATTPHGVGPNLGLLYQHSAIRYFAPINGDGVKSSITLLNPGAGQTTAIICADQGFTSFLGVQFDTLTGTDHVRIVIGSGPVTMAAQASVVDTIANGDRYLVFYDELTNTTHVYKGASLTPILSWADTLDVVPHGQGYRYLGFSWQADLITTGPQITDWVAQDDAGPTEAGS